MHDIDEKHRAAILRDARSVLRRTERKGGMTPEIVDDAVAVLVQVVAALSPTRKPAAKRPAARRQAPKPAYQRGALTTTLVVNVARGQDRLVPSISEASRAVRYHLQTHGLGASQWTGTGLVYTAQGTPVARISYNGRAWAVDERGKETGAEIPL